MKTKTVKRIYIEMLKFEIKQNEHVNKMKLNKRFSKKIKIAEDLNGIIVKGNVAVALSWNGNSETWNKEAELNTFWFWEKIDWQAWVEDWKTRLLDFIEKDERWAFWGGTSGGFESLDLMTLGIEEEKLLWFVAETEMDDLGVAEILGPENIERQKQSCEAKFVKELDFNE